METEKTPAESFVQKIRDVLDSDLNVNDPVQFQIMLDAISIATAVATIAPPTDYYEENDGSGQLYWGLHYSSNRVAVFIKKRSNFDIDCFLDQNVQRYRDIPFAAVVPLLIPMLAQLHALKQEARG